MVAINPVRTGYAAIADEWIGIRPGTDGLFVLALVHELLRLGRVDLDYLARLTDAGWLVVDAPGTAERRPLRARRGGPAARRRRGHRRGRPGGGRSRGRGSAASPTLPDGRRARTVFALLAERYRDARVRARGREPSAAASRPRRSGGSRPRSGTSRSSGRSPSSSHGPTRAACGMRASSAGRWRCTPCAGSRRTANGFQTCRALHLLQLLIGSVDVPGGWRYKAPYPRPCPPGPRPSGRPEEIVPGKPLPGSPLGFPRGPEDLLLEADGRPVRIDKAFSWDAPLAVHGMLQTVIANAWRGDPYPVEVLFLYMANMAWNSAMNPGETMRMLADKDPATGAYRIPRFIYVDAYHSETVAYADLVLPDTTYLERWDCISLLDRPIGTAHGPGDAIRQPVVAPDRDVRPFQEVLIDLGVRLKLPAFAHPDGEPRYPGGYPDYLVHHQRKPGIGPLAGWRGGQGRRGRAVARPTTGSSRPTSPTAASGSSTCRPRRATSSRSTAPISPGRASWACSTRRHRSRSTSTPRRCSASGSPPQGHGAVQPPDSHRERIRTHFDPLPFWYQPFEQAAFADADFPLHAITQRPMPMYHSWGSQNAWLRQILARNFLYMNRRTGAELGLADGDWVEVTSPHGRTRAQLRLMDGCAERHGLDLERDRQAGRRLGSGAGCARGRARLPAQPRHRRAAARGARLQPRQRRPDHRAGRLVRPAGPGPQAGRPARRMIEPRIPGDRADAAHDRVRAGRAGAEAARAGHRPRHLRRLPCLRHRLQVLERPGPSRPALRPRPLRRRAGRRLAQPRPQLRGRRGATAAAPSTSPAPACTAPSPPASRSARPAPPTSASRTASCWSNAELCIGCGLCAWACPYGARELDPVEHVMRKCTLCIDRIYNTEPARGRAAAGLRHGLPDPRPAFRRSRRSRAPTVSRLVAERGGVDLLPELGYRPVNRYLPPREPVDLIEHGARAGPEPKARSAAADRLFRWLDRILST